MFYGESGLLLIKIRIIIKHILYHIGKIQFIPRNIEKCPGGKKDQNNRNDEEKNNYLLGSVAGDAVFFQMKQYESG